MKNFSAMIDCYDLRCLRTSIQVYLASISNGVIRKQNQQCTGSR